jgi:hypothetical protein
MYNSVFLLIINRSAIIVPSVIILITVITNAMQKAPGFGKLNSCLLRIVETINEKTKENNDISVFASIFPNRTNRNPTGAVYIIERVPICRSLFISPAVEKQLQLHTPISPALSTTYDR